MDLSVLAPEVFEHAQREYPNECCGLAVVFKGRLKYVPCTNSLKGDAFLIPSEEYAAAEDLGEVVGVCHSHPHHLPEPSPADVVACESSKLPWLIVSLVSNTYKQIEPTGYKPPLIGRPFYHGVLDCFTIIQDYYREELGIELATPRRDFEWWRHGQNLYLDNYRDWGFVEVKDLQKHDVILMQNGCDVINHGAVYIGDGMILQHCTNRLSSRDVYGGYWRKNTRLIVRHNTLL